MAYRVIDKKVNTGDTTYSTLSDFKNALVSGRGYVDSPMDYLNIISDLSTSSLSDTQKNSLENTIVGQSEVFDVDNQSFTRTRDYEDQATYQAYQATLNGISDADFDTTWPNQAGAPITRTVISEGTV